MRRESRGATCAALLGAALLGGALMPAVTACGAGSEEHPAPEAAAPAPAPAVAEPALDRAAVRARAKGIFGVLPAEAASPDNPITPEKVVLGRMLYYDTRMSVSQTISCNSCHPLDRFGVDGEPTSPGHAGKRGERNSPSVYNAALQVAQFWDGRAANVEAQAKGPVLNPVEMGMPSEGTVLEVLHSIPGYAPLFQAAFPGEGDPITYDNAARAIGAFERKLVTPGPFDDFLSGDDAALDDAQLRGLVAFMDTGCITCHNGATVGGNSFQKLGLVKAYPTEDVGREKVTGNAADRFVFKVPSLRNVARTAPYFMDGSIPSLGQAIRTMAEVQLGKTLSDAEVASIESFLGALTGRVDGAYVARPDLPASGPHTPAPDRT
jgi:cytochrome c peroxidase